MMGPSVPWYLFVSGALFGIGALGVLLAYIHIFFFGASIFAPVLKGWAVLYPEFILTPFIDFQQLQRLFCDVYGNCIMAADLGKITHAPQQPVGNARGKTAAVGQLQHVGGPLDVGFAHLVQRGVHAQVGGGMDDVGDAPCQA